MLATDLPSEEKPNIRLPTSLSLKAQQHRIAGNKPNTQAYSLWQVAVGLEHTIARNVVFGLRFPIFTFARTSVQGEASLPEPLTFKGNADFGIQLFFPGRSSVQQALELGYRTRGPKNPYEDEHKSNRIRSDNGRVVRDLYPTTKTPSSFVVGWRLGFPKRPFSTEPNLFRVAYHYELHAPKESFGQLFSWGGFLGISDLLNRLLWTGDAFDPWSDRRNDHVEFGFANRTRLFGSSFEGLVGVEGQVRFALDSAYKSMVFLSIGLGSDWLTPLLARAELKLPVWSEKRNDIRASIHFHAIMQFK